MESLPAWGGAGYHPVRANLTFRDRTADGRGAVFSADSITWIASLPHNGFSNNISLITEREALNLHPPLHLPGNPSGCR
jgi:hypothetical protein